MSKNKRRVLVGSIGDCVHSLGVETFAEWMEDKGIGYFAVKLGPAVAIQDVINKIRESRPAVVGISSRLGDLHVDKLIREFMDKALEHGIDPQNCPIRYTFGGLRPAANLVRAMTGVPLLEDKFSPRKTAARSRTGGRRICRLPRYKNFFEANRRRLCHHGGAGTVRP